MVCPARGDVLYLRKTGIPAIGFSPMPYTECLMHDNDESLNKNVFLTGINTYVGLVKALGNL